MGTQRSYRLTVAEVVQETRDAISIVFEVDAEHADEFLYRPGQFLTLRIPSEQTGSVARCYSLCSSPHTDRQLIVAVKRTPDGYASNWLCDNLSAGFELDVLPPSGSFGPASFSGDFMLFAAGSGITPIMSIVKSLLHEGEGDIALFYANRDQESVIFGKEFEKLEAEYPERLRITHWIESEQGLPHAKGIAEFAGSLPARPAYACGPKPFMEIVQHGLKLGDPSHRGAHVENFVSLARNPFEDEPAEARQAGAVRTEVTVDLLGDTHTLAWPDGTPLLELLLSNGLDAPFACQEGTCGSCVCRVDEGSVEMLSNETLEDDDVDQGYVLACQAVPTGGVVRVRYE